MKTYETPVEPNVAHADSDKILADLRMLATDTEELLRATAGRTGQQLGAARARADASLAAAKARVGNLGRVAVDRTRAAGRATDGYVHANPWQVIAIGAAAGFVIGALLARGGTPDAP
jgi:ElaB/YqjD/DUF883 family membrane-anchored ribosome-binding protein